MKDKKLIPGPRVLYTLLFLLVSLGGFAALALHGKSLIWEVDGFGQYYPVFCYIGDYIRDFLNSLLAGQPCLKTFDLSIGMGEDVIGSLNYYGFGDPLNLLAVFAVGGAAYPMYVLLFFLRLYLAGQAFIAYARKMGLRSRAAAFGALCYVFSGFTLVGAVSYYEWLSVLIYFPLLLIGCEETIRTGRFSFTMALGTAYGALTGFYYLYMSSLVLAAYALIRLFSRCGARSFGCVLGGCLRCLGGYLTGILLASPILVPALDAFLKSQRAGQSPMKVLLDWHNYIPVLNKDLIKSVLGLLYPTDAYISGITVSEVLAVLLFLAMPLFFCVSKRIRRQFWAASILALTALHLPITGYLFNAFGETNDRWVFAVHMLLALLLTYTLEVLVSAPLSEGTELPYRRVLAATAAALVPVNLVLVMWLLYSPAGLNWQEEFIDLSAMGASAMSSPVTASRTITEDDELFLVAVTSIRAANGRPENVAMLNGYNGLTYWFSIVNANTQAYNNLNADVAYRWRSYGLNGQISAETLAGVKYVMTNDPAHIPAGYPHVETVDFEGIPWQVYENPYYDGLAYVRSEAAAAALRETFIGDEAAWEALKETGLNNDIDNPGRATDKTPIDGSAFRRYLDAVLGERLNSPCGSVSNLTWEHGCLTMTVVIEEGGELVVAMPDSGGWQAEVDGKAWEISSADIRDMSLKGIPAGVHTVTLTCRSAARRLGLGLGLGGLLLLIGLAVKKRTGSSRKTGS